MYKFSRTLVEASDAVGKSEHRATLLCLLWVTVLLQHLMMKTDCLVGSDGVLFSLLLSTGLLSYSSVRLRACVRLLHSERSNP